MTAVRASAVRGLWLAALCCAASATALADANLLANPGFETGTFAGWTLAGETRPDHSFVSGAGWQEWLPHSGDRFAALGASGFENYLLVLSLSQSFATTPGETYLFSFQLGSDGEKPSFFDARWNGASVFSRTDAPETPGHDLIHGPAAAAYVAYNFSVVATGSTTSIDFVSGNEPGWWALDDVSVMPLPEPSSSLALAAGALAVIACHTRRRRSS